MSTLKTNNIQVGQSATSSQNFVLKTNNDGTLKIARGNIGAELGDVLTVNADGTLVMPGAVGTVSQVDGVPTGALIESGSNANGSYERYASGLQITRQTTASQTINATTATGTDFYTAPAFPRFTFPAAFIATPDSTYSVATGFGLMWVSQANAPTNTQTSQLYVIAGGSVSSTGTFTIIAVGRWF